MRKQNSEGVQKFIYKSMLIEFAILTPSVTCGDSSLKEGALEKEVTIMSLPYKHNLISTAKRLRKNMTPQERHLWYDFLRMYPVRFQRQKAIGNYIADFYCHSAKLVVEIDGSQHFTVKGSAYDAERTKQLEQFGVTVIRFSNYDVNTNFDGVCLEIDRVVRECLSDIP